MAIPRRKLPLLLRLQAGEKIDHRRRKIRVVVDNFPCPGFSAIYIGDTVIKIDLVSSHRDMALFDANFVGHVSGGANVLIMQLDLSAGSNLGDLAPGWADFVPPSVSTA